MRAPASGFFAPCCAAQRHQAGHLLLGEADFLAAELGERQILHLERLAAGGFRRGERVQLLDHSCHAVSPSISRDLSIADDGRSAFVTRASACVSPVATNSAGPFACASGGSGTIRTSVESGVRRAAAELLLGEPEPDVAHLLPVVLAVVRQHVDDDQRGRPASARAPPRRARAPAPARGAAPASASPHRARRRRSAAPRARRAAARRCRRRAAASSPPAASPRNRRRR